MLLVRAPSRPTSRGWRSPCSSRLPSLTIACARVFALAFWRPLPAHPDADHHAAEDAFRAPAPGTSPRDHSAGGSRRPCVFSVIAIGVWPQPLADLSMQAAHQVLHPSQYLAAVLGELP